MIGNVELFERETFERHHSEFAVLILQCSPETLHRPFDEIFAFAMPAASEPIILASPTAASSVRNATVSSVTVPEGLTAAIVPPGPPSFGAGVVTLVGDLIQVNRYHTSALGLMVLFYRFLEWNILHIFFILQLSLNERIIFFNCIQSLIMMTPTERVAAPFEMYDYPSVMAVTTNPAATNVTAIPTTITTTVVNGNLPLGLTTPALNNIAVPVLAHVPDLIPHPAVAVESPENIIGPAATASNANDVLITIPVSTAATAALATPIEPHRHRTIRLVYWVGCVILVVFFYYLFHSWLSFSSYSTVVLAPQRSSLTIALRSGALSPPLRVGQESGALTPQHR